MKIALSSLRLMIALILAGLLGSCGGGSQPTDDLIDTPAQEPQDPVDNEIVDIKEPIIFGLTTGESSITVAFSHELLSEETSPEITFNFYYALEEFEIDQNESGGFEDEDMSLDELQERFSSRAGATLLEDVQSPLKLTGLSNDTFYYFVITATTAENGTSAPTDELRATPRDYSAINLLSYKLNDTGKVTCGDFRFVDTDGDGDVDTQSSQIANNHIDCVNGEADPQGDLVPEPSQQDAYIGRDYLAMTSGLTKTGSGLAGFDFSKLDENGDDLPYSATDWSCVRDNHTGLIWEVKKSEGLHNSADRFSWYNEDELSNGGFEGYKRAGDFGGLLENNTCFGFVGGQNPTYCNSSYFIERVNTAGLCGASDWRLPTRLELVGLVNFELQNINPLNEHRPSLDTNFFPNTEVSTGFGSVRYLTSDPYARSTTAIWGVYLGSGGSIQINKALPNAIMLVRKP